MFDTITLNLILWSLLFLGVFILIATLILLITKALALKRNVDSFGISEETSTKPVEVQNKKAGNSKSISSEDQNEYRKGNTVYYTDNIENYTDSTDNHTDSKDYNTSSNNNDANRSEDLKENSKTFFKALLDNIKEDKVPDLGAQTTFYLVLALFPFFIFLLSVLQYTPLNYATIVTNIEGLLPEQAQELIFETIEEVFSGSSGTLLSFSVIGALWSSLKGANGLIKAVNTAYNVEETRNFFQVKGVALLITLGVPIVILLAFFFIVFGEVLGTYVFDFIGLSDNFIDLWSWLRFPIPIIAMILFFMLFYKFAPSLHLKFKNVFWGALFTVIFWLIASLGFSIYVNNFGNYANVYGSLGSVVVVLLWLYLSSIIIIIGGEINVILSRLRKGQL